ncbi:probable cationic amino acid transporter [Parasteatoda tepidariorum]|uniref:probable cationic amino acid transporter n=1 Tax=Parasteatoda tepidariorum TaxID=114398 RepID=UPI001C71C73A|nr:probable cationic amino acid transporter [Parasteatoda tepidariorum]
MGENMRQMYKVLFRKKTTMSAETFQNNLGSLSIVDVTCLGLATALGTGVYALIAIAAHDHAGPSVVLAVLMAAVTSCLGGLCYSEVVTRFPKGGSAYSYVYSTMGELFAFIIGWGMVLDYTVGAALASKVCSQYLNAVLDSKISNFLQGHVGQLSFTGLDKFLDLPAVAVNFWICIMLFSSIKILCTLNNIFVVVNLLVISGTVVVGIFNMDSENWIAGLGFFPNGISGIISASSLCFFAFVGYDILAICTKASPHRSHTFPSTVSSIFVIGLLSCFSISIILTLLVPFSMIEAEAPLLQAFDVRQVDGMKYFIAIGALFGLISSVVASLVSLVKLFESLGADGLLFKFLSRTQSHSLLAAGVLSSILSLLCSTKTLVHVLGMGTLTAYMSIALCVLCTRYGVGSRFRADALERTTLDSLELYEEDSPNDVKTTDKCSEKLCQTEKDHMNDHTKPIYGTLSTKSVSVDFIDESYMTCLSELSPHWTKQEPNHRSAATVAGLIGAALLVMLLMGVMTLHIPKLLPQNHLWTELFACVLFLLIIGCAAAIFRQPKHKPQINNKVPCIPFLPLISIWMNVHLIVGLPYTAWLLFFIWSLIGSLLYLSYGIWNSSERNFQDPQGVNLLNVNEDGCECDKDNLEDEKHEH